MLVPERRLGLNKRKVATADTTVRFFSIRREYIEIKRTRGAQKSELKKKNNPTVYWTKRLAKRTVRERDRKKRGGGIDPADTVDATQFAFQTGLCHSWQTLKHGRRE